MFGLMACGEARPIEEILDQAQDPIQGGCVQATDNLEVGMVAPNLTVGGCTGALIAPSLVLTANHCVPTNPPWPTFYTGPNVNNMVAREVVQVNKAVCPGSGSDCALLRLKFPVRDIKPRPLETNPSLTYPVGSSCNVVGYGNHTEGGVTTWGTRRIANVSITSATTTLLNYQAAAGATCSGYPTSGDSGAPVVCGGFNIAAVHSGSDAVARRANNATVHSAAWQWQPEPALSVASPATNRLDAFARGTDGNVYQQTWNGLAWSGWSSRGAPPGGPIRGTPEAASWGSNRLDVFVRDVDRSLWRTFWAGQSWSAWSSLGVGVGLLSHPSVVSWGAGRLDVFAVDAANGWVFHKDWNGTTWEPSAGGWESLGSGGSTFTEYVKAVSWGPNRLDVFAVSANGRQLYHKSGTGYLSWSAWENLGGEVVGQFAVVSRGPNLIDVFIAQEPAAPRVYHKRWNGSCWEIRNGSGWQCSQLGWWLMSTPSTVNVWGGVSAFASGTNRIDVVAPQNILNGVVLGDMIWTSWNGTTWSNAQLLTGPIVGNPIIGRSATGSSTSLRWDRTWRLCTKTGTAVGSPAGAASAASSAGDATTARVNCTASREIPAGSGGFAAPGRATTESRNHGSL